MGVCGNVCYVAAIVKNSAFFSLINNNNNNCLKSNIQCIEIRVQWTILPWSVEGCCVFV